MDGQRFDELTRALASGASRRRVLAGLAGGVATALGLGARRRVGAQNGCGEIDDACFGDFDCCQEACFKPQGRRRGKCVCPTEECGGVCCSGEQICGDAVRGRLPDAVVVEGCCLPPGALMPGVCSRDTFYQCCSIGSDPDDPVLCCVTDDTTGLGRCCEPRP